MSDSCISLTCFFGNCTLQATSGGATKEVCVCDPLYGNRQCSFRNGILYFEVPLAYVLLLGVLVVGLRLHDRAIQLLRFEQAEQDDFEFPRDFECTQRNLGVLTPFVGTWTGPTEKHLPLKNQGLLARAFILMAMLMEVVSWAQIAATCFLPIVPWSSTAQVTTNVSSGPFCSNRKPLTTLTCLNRVLPCSSCASCCCTQCGSTQPPNPTRISLFTALWRLYRWVCLPLAYWACVGSHCSSPSPRTLPWKTCAR